MTPTQARHVRRAVPQAAVTASAARAGGDPDLFFRADDEGLAAWQAGRTEAIRLRTGCPVRATCEELTLRDGDGRPDTDEMLRAGLTGRMSTTTPVPRAGWLEDQERDDNHRVFERDETDNAFRQLVHRLAVDGDARARSAGRQARRTLAEMAPGYQRQPVLLLTRPLTFRSADDACPLCGYWTCRCGGVAPAPECNGTLQCDQCGGRFGYTGPTCWTCAACKQLQGAALPPTPHERDGRTEQPSAPARPHSAVPKRHRP
ncbi:hypothetical protein AB0D56_32615 [Streptomyces sp. NPDC048209]|uniref:hypothetical protein n=1 Tax=unclassified Streptomyces TaxID=2593676 RepID=UPI0033E154E9